MKHLLRDRPFISMLTGLLIFIAWRSLSLSADEDAIDDWQQFERRARDGRITIEDGRGEIGRWAEVLESLYPADRFAGSFFFPLRGYALQAVGGNNGEGYKPAGYEFLGGNRHKGHPAQDIFISDRNQDALDDGSGQPVEVLSVADGIVLSIFSEWTADDAHRHIRGGNYIWIYHPAMKMFSYYAHLKDVPVQPGDRVAGGAAIATLGRTGTNAYPPRSPTHLHLMLLRLKDMTPVDPYPLLRTGFITPSDTRWRRCRPLEMLTY